MSFGLLNTLMLFGLAALSLPVLIHLLNRRRFEVVDWGAMQFLQVSQTTRRRLLIEELLLMALRMLLIAVLVLALAAPFVAGEVLTPLGNRPNRDVVLAIDGSASMDYRPEGTAIHELAKDWALQFIKDLQPGDSAALVEARPQAVPVIGELTHDRERMSEAIRSLPPPAGGCDWPAAVQLAVQILESSQRTERAVILLTDGQRQGWADEASLLRWSLLAERLRQQGSKAPRIWVINLDPERPDDPPNWSLAPVRASRAVAVRGQTVTFRSALQLHGQLDYRPPHRLRLEIDGRAVADLKSPAGTPLDKDSQVPFSFQHRFPATGSHLVSVIVEPDPPLDQRPASYVVKDRLPADNRQDFALDILPALPVVIVDDERDDAIPADQARQRRSDFLRDALAPARDPHPTALVRVVASRDFDPSLLFQNIGQETGTRPRVLVLANVVQLTPGQQEAVGRFLAEGGGVLVALGDRVDARHYNTQLFGGGQGWLPAMLDKIVGDEADPKQAASPQVGTFTHPALELFRTTTIGGLGEARFPRWWKVHPPGRGSGSTLAGLLTTNDPFLVEKLFSKGRVLLCAVPLDNSGATNLTDLPAFAPLVHELVYYLAGARGTEHNLKAGEPLIYRPAAVLPINVRLQRPRGPGEELSIERTPLIYDGTREPGVYRLEDGGTRVYYVVQPDPRESNLLSCSEADRENVRRLVPLTYETDRAKLSFAGAEQRQELWWLFLGAVIVLLCGEIWLTRRMVRSR